MRAEAELGREIRAGVTTSWGPVSPGSTPGRPRPTAAGYFLNSPTGR
jgi:hypothetical protein